MTPRAAELRRKLQTICFSGGEIGQKKVAVVMKKIEQEQAPIPGVFQEPQNSRIFSRRV